MVVIGTHGRHGLGKLILGSVAEQIFRHADCLVLTVGPGSFQDAPVEGSRAIRPFLFATDFGACRCMPCSTPSPPPITSGQNSFCSMSSQRSRCRRAPIVLGNKVALVTGGVSGIGLSTCRLLAREGACVAITDILDTEGKRTADDINSSGGSARFWHLDVSREDEVREVLRQVRQTFGRIDVLVNNVVILGANKPTHEITEQEWDHLMAINVKGVFFCTKHAVPYMKETGGGSVINLSSIYGSWLRAMLPRIMLPRALCALMTKNDAILYAPDKIRVNSVHPGFIWTAMVEKLAAGTGAGAEAVRQQFASKHPIGHLGEPDDVAWGIVYLAPEEAKFVTGSELVIDGGYTAQ